MNRKPNEFDQSYPESEYNKIKNKVDTQNNDFEFKIFLLFLLKINLLY